MSSPGTIDRSPLTIAECKIIDNLISCKKTSFAQTNMLSRLPRLALPICETIEQLHRSKLQGAANRSEWLSRCRENALRGIVSGMAANREGYWTWTDSQWRDLVSEQRSGCLVITAVAYKLCGAKPYQSYPKRISLAQLYRMIFGQEAWLSAETQVMKVLESWKYRTSRGGVYKRGSRFDQTLACALLDSESVDLDGITYGILEAIQKREDFGDRILPIASVLFHLGIIDRKLESKRTYKEVQDRDSSMAQGWFKLIAQYEALAVCSKSQQKSVRWAAEKAGRWMRENYPEVERPEDWTPDIALEYIAAVNEMKVGEYVFDVAQVRSKNLGKPITARTKDSLITHLKIFFGELQRKRLISRLNFDLETDLQVPQSIRNLIGPDPRDIDENAWLKLIWASLNLSDDELKGFYYPPELLRAVSIMFTHSALRFDELRRLSVGCTRPIKTGSCPQVSDTVRDITELVCLLDVPISKTASAFTKPVPVIVDQVVKAWEAVRGDPPPLLDKKTSKHVNFLFVYREKKISAAFVRKKLIPFLCSKVGIPAKDGRGNYTWHRGRASSATGLYNSEVGMSLEELRLWLGHRSIRSTENYVRFNPHAQAHRFAQIESQNYLSNILQDAETDSLNHAQGAQILTQLEDGGFCSNPMYDTCQHKDSCGTCPFHIDRENPSAKMLHAQSLLRDFYDTTNLQEEKQEFLKFVIDFLNN